MRKGPSEIPQQNILSGEFRGCRREIMDMAGEVENPADSHVSLFLSPRMTPAASHHDCDEIYFLIDQNTIARAACEVLMDDYWHGFFCNSTITGRDTRRWIKINFLVGLEKLFFFFYYIASY